MTPYLERGFAVAASDYSIQGFAVVQGVNETEVLRKYFVKKYGRPDKTFMVGGSMGGVLPLPQSRTLVKTTMEVTNGQGHCAFTPQQIGQVFDELRAWANTGKKPEPGAIE